MRSLPVCEPGALLFFCDSKRCREWVLRDCIARNPEQSPLASPQMTQPSNTEIFPLVLETRPVSRKPMGRWKEFKGKDCQIILNLSELLRVEERQWEGCFFGDFCSTSNCILLSTLSLCPVVCLFVFLHTSVCLDQPVGLSLCLSLCLVVNLQPCSLTICVWICSHTANPSAHRWCWHLLWDPGWWQGAQSLPEGQGAAGDQAPQSHGEGELRVESAHHFPNKRDKSMIFYCSMYNINVWNISIY